MATIPRGGIPDWEKKKTVLTTLLEVFTVREMFEKVIGGGIDKAGTVQKLTDASRKWGNNTPLSESTFFAKLIAKLNENPETAFKPGMTVPQFLRVDIIQFINHFSSKTARDLAKTALGMELSEENESIQQSTALHPGATCPVLYLHDTEETYSMAAGIRTGHLDTRNYYSTEDAAETWAHLVSAEAYPTYDQCKTGLQALTVHNEWKKRLRESSPTIAVMLAGGGSPTKDLIVARSLLDNQKNKSSHVKMVLVDVSPHMLIQSQVFLARTLRELHESERIEFKYVRADVYSIGKHPEIIDRNGAIVFAITGGTIGNLSERMFFHSLNPVAKSGDLLIISADTIDDVPAEQLQRILADKYNNPEMRRMIAPGVTAILTQLKINESIQSAARRITVEVVPNAVRQLSDVPDSWNVIVSLPVKGKSITLVRSTRYCGQSLVALAEQYGWESVCSAPSPLNPSYLQFGFRRK